MPAGPARVRCTILTTDPDNPQKAVTIEQVLMRTGPDKLTFVRGEQPADATLYRQRLCKKMGAVPRIEMARRNQAGHTHAHSNVSSPSRILASRVSAPHDLIQ